MHVGSHLSNNVGNNMSCVDDSAKFLENHSGYGNNKLYVPE